MKQVILTTIIFLWSFSIIHGNTPIEKRQVIFMDQSMRTADPGDSGSNPVIENHDQTGYAYYLHAKNSHVVRARVAVLPDFETNEMAARFYLSINGYGPLFGIEAEDKTLAFVSEKTIEDSENALYRGRTFVRFKQNTLSGYPVLGAEIVVILDARKQLIGMIGEILPNVKQMDVPSSKTEDAISMAKQIVAEKMNVSVNSLTVSNHQLVLYSPTIVEDFGAPGQRLVYKIIVSGGNFSECVFMDASYPKTMVFSYSYDPFKALRLIPLSQSGAIEKGISKIQSNMTDISQNLPDRISSPFYQCDSRKNGGISINSALIEKLAFLLINGGQHNGQSILPIAFDRVSQLFQETLNDLLPPAPDFKMLYYALVQTSSHLGFSNNEYAQLIKGLNAVELDQSPCQIENPGTQLAAVTIPGCIHANISPNKLFFDGLENNGANWQSTALKGNNFWLAGQQLSIIGQSAAHGRGNIWSRAQAGISDSSIAMKKDILIPEVAFLHFNHAFLFERSSHTSEYFNGGIVEFSVDKGNHWTDATSLFVNNGYNGKISSQKQNPLGGRNAFVSGSMGYISSRLDLSSLSGSHVRFRFRMATSGIAAYYGWFIDDIMIYTCDLFASMPYICQAPDIKTINNGDWFNASTWNLNRIPRTTDIVKILKNHQVNTKHKIHMKGLCNEGVLLAYGNQSLNIQADLFLYNKQSIKTNNGANRQSNIRNAKPQNGQPITIRGFAVLNTINGSIISGSGGRNIKGFSASETVPGGHAGNITLSGDFFVNNGTIRGGNGGYASTGNNRYTRGSSYGGNGANIVLTAVQSLINDTNGKIYAGNGGSARAWSGNTAKPGSGGNIIFVSSHTINRGKIFLDGRNGSRYIWEPEIGMSGEDAEIIGADQIRIFGGKNWQINLSNLKEGAIQGNHIEIALGKNGILNLMDCETNAFESNVPVDIFVKQENILLTGGSSRSNITRQIKNIFNTEKTYIHGPEIRYDIDMTISQATIYGLANENAELTATLYNNGPVSDVYTIQVDCPSNLKCSSSHNIISLPALSNETLSILLNLPETAGESYMPKIQVTSIASPDQQLLKNILVKVQPQYVDFDIHNDSSDPFLVSCERFMISDTIQINDFKWDFGNGETSKEINPSHRYTENGTYSIVLSITTTEGQTERVAHQVTIQKQKILLLAADYIESTRDALCETGIFQKEDIDIIERPSSIQLSELSAYDAVLVWTRYAFNDREAIGDVLKAYVDDGGGVVLAGYCFSEEWGLLGGILSPGYSPFLIGPEINASGQMDMASITDLSHVIFNGIKSAPDYWVNVYTNAPEINTDGVVLAKDTSGYPLVASNTAGTVVGISIYPERLSFGNDEAKQLFANALLSVCGLPSQLHVHPKQYHVKAIDGCQTFHVSNQGEGQMHWMARSLDDWVHIQSEDSGINTGDIRVCFDAHDLNVERKGRIHLLAVGAIDYSQTLSIVQEANMAPVISDIDSVTTYEDTKIDVTFDISDQETMPEKLIVSAQAQNALLIPDHHFSFNNPGKNRIMRITPAENMYGETTITLTLSDGIRFTNQEFMLTVVPVNDPPNFQITGDIVLPENAGAQIIPAWIFGITPGPNETETYHFEINAEPREFFKTMPFIDDEGQLTFEGKGNGSVELAVQLIDHGNTETPHQNKSLIKTFSIRYDFLPSFLKGDNPIVLEDSGIQTINQWVNHIKTGPYGQFVQFNTSTNSPDLFSVLPTITPDGTLTFKPAPNAFGKATVYVNLFDGGIEKNKSPDQKFTITIIPVNDPPNFVGTSLETLEDSGKQRIENWVSQVSSGASNEHDQSISFQVTTSHPEWFSDLPHVLNDGTLIYESKENIFGQVDIQIIAQDNGGTDNGGFNTSDPKTYTLSILPVNDPPTFFMKSLIENVEDIFTLDDTGFVTNIRPGPANESDQGYSFSVYTDNPELFSILPSISKQGSLSYQLKPEHNGTAWIMVHLIDTGDTENGGNNISDPLWARIIVDAQNDCPYFHLPQPFHMASDNQQQTLTSWVTEISAGENEDEQQVEFILTTDQADLFIIPPSLSPQGTLNYQFFQDVVEPAKIQMYLVDDSPVIGCSRYPRQDLTITLYPKEYKSEPEEFVLSLKTGWNLVSIPISLSDESMALIMNVSQSIFTFNSGSYQLSSQWECFKGYWIKCDQDYELVLKGKACQMAPVELEKGWHLIGCGLNETSISTVPESAANVMYEFEYGAYQWVDMKCVAGKGYWLKVLEDCVMGE